MRAGSVLLAVVLLGLSGSMAVAQAPAADQDGAGATEATESGAIQMAQAAETTQTSESTAPSEASDAAAVAGAADAGDAAPPGPGDAAGVDLDDWEMPAMPEGFDDDIFIPSEEVEANEEVVFPVDI